MKPTSLILFFFLLGLSLPVSPQVEQVKRASDLEQENAGSQTVSLSFLEISLSFTHNSSLFEEVNLPLTDEMLLDFYQNIPASQYEATLGELLQIREHYRLTDWLYFLLIRDLAEEIYASDADHYKQTLFCWLFLAKTGFKVQLNYHRSGVFLSIYTLDQVFDLPVKRHGIGWLVEISRFQKPELTEFVPTVRSDFYLNTTAKPFRMRMQECPVLPIRGSQVKSFHFAFEGKTYSINAEIDQNMIEMMELYPELSVKTVSEFPVSDLVFQSMMPDLSKHLEDRTEAEKVRFLLSFTRTAFVYKADRENNNTLCAEETLFSKHSDCEDRVVLFSYLVRELMNLPVLVLEFSDHVAAAIELDNVYGRPIYFEGRSFTFVEPTDTKDILGLGEYPAGLSEETYIIQSK